MIKKFWQFVGLTYLFLAKKKKIILYTILVLVILGQIFMSVLLVVNQLAMKKDQKKNHEASMKLINKTYSQVWQLNSKLNEQLKANNEK